MAGWQSGYAAACKAVYAGSIPTPASSIHCNHQRIDSCHEVRFCTHRLLQRAENDANRIIAFVAILPMEHQWNIKGSGFNSRLHRNPAQTLSSLAPRSVYGPRERRDTAG